VDQSTGNVGMAWYDARNNASTNTIVQMFGAISTDGGVTVNKNFLVSPDHIHSSLAEPPAVGDRPLGVGDFNKIDFANGNLQIDWADNSTTLPGNPDAPHFDVATARVRVAPQLKVSVIFPPRWRLVNAAHAIYFGRITIINRSGIALLGPFMLTITLPKPSLSFLMPANTQVGNTVTFTINANLPRNVPVRVGALLVNPLHVHLPTALVGFASSLA
jgi:hypothetical protein